MWVYIWVLGGLLVVVEDGIEEISVNCDLDLLEGVTGATLRV